MLNKGLQMFEFIKKIFKQKENNNNDYNLIDLLKKDHQKLISICNKIEIELNNNNFQIIKEELQKFITDYNKHIIVEDTQLYIKLEEKYKEQTQILNTIKNIEIDMNTITKTILDFEKKFDTINSDNKEAFWSELKSIESILIQRIELEEERLYTLL